jgi:hypothetical protein
LDKRNLETLTNPLRLRDNELSRGPVAQLGARFHGMEEVVGSNPTRSTNQPFQFQSSTALLHFPLSAIR